MTPPPPPLSEGLDPPLTEVIILCVFIGRLYLLYAIFKGQMAQRLMKDIAVVLSLGLKKLTEQAINKGRVQRVPEPIFSLCMNSTVETKLVKQGSVCPLRVNWKV